MATQLYNAHAGASRRGEAHGIAGLVHRLRARGEEYARYVRTRDELAALTDRELADIGLCRADIHFAVRETAQGVMPELDHVTHSALPANENLRRVA